MNFGYGGGSFGGRENWKPPLFHIGKLPINVTGLVILLQAIGMLLVVFLPDVMSPLAIFEPGMFMKGAFWQVVTYPFFAAPTIGLIVGLFFFYILGGMVENTLDRGGYIRLLLAVALMPPVIVLLANLIGLNGLLQGSNLPNLAIFVAAVTMIPNAPSFFNIRIKWFAVAFVGIAFLQFLMIKLLGNCLALAAVIYLAYWWMRQAGHVSKWGVVDDVLGPRAERQKRKKKKLPGKKRVYEKKLKPRTNISTSESRDIDKILDKINEHGLHSLTEEERQLLQKAGKK